MPSEQLLYLNSFVDQGTRGLTSQSSARPGSSLEHNTHGQLRWGQRPKSTPISAKRSHRFSGGQHQTTNISRPKTAAVILGRTECDRVQQLESEPTRRHNFESHLPLKRAKPPPWQRNLEAPLVPFQTGPGYILTRSKTKCHVTIKDEFFDPILDEVDRKQPRADPERDNLIAQLQQQISDLTLYLEEERLNHRQTKQKAEEYLRDKMEQMSSQHQDQTRELEERHKEEMMKQKRQMEDEHKEVQTTLEKQINRMSKEIEFLQGAFESYKSTLHTETTDKWKAREEEMKQGNANDKQQALHDLKSRLMQERNQEKAIMTRDHQKALEALRKENKREMDVSG
ncbi:Amyotrophic lateral sclerosis 2 chromosomal region candidate gene 12 protein [Plakobranchus ocellatus]|uniref:Amyotrophic lateral sclerosis 2 chromosomal region candidate gene 12 protein n=1 Tax=Plakobranchus ocellatus TaxID=259542 RepID=A0AAV4CI21_9GAST|nr:Amyotrophic lateral sclerosis 2 chromosomal region candidate gene 12 protein [Plakobranchus ocellatus]